MLYKYLDIDGGINAIKKQTVKFSNINEWRNGGSNDCKENYIAGCFENEVDFKEMLSQFDKEGFDYDQRMRHFYGIALYSYQTYASCFCKSMNNRNYMWNEFIRQGGLCLAFKDELFDHLCENYSKTHELVEGEIGCNVFDFKQGSITYSDELPKITDIVGTIEDVEDYLPLAYYSKRRFSDNGNNYEAEDEFRITATRMDILATALSVSIPNTVGKLFDFSLENVSKYLYERHLIDVHNKSPVYLKYDIESDLYGVYTSPINTTAQNEEIRDTCHKNNIQILDTIL